MPVPIAKNTQSLALRPAPKRASPQAAEFASCSKRTGMPMRSSRFFRTVALRHGKCGAKRTIVQVGSIKPRSEEHTSELQSRGHLVCRLLLEKKKNSPHVRDRLDSRIDEAG